MLIVLCTMHLCTVTERTISEDSLHDSSNLCNDLKIFLMVPHLEVNTEGNLRWQSNFSVMKVSLSNSVLPRCFYVTAKLGSFERSAFKLVKKGRTKFSFPGFFGIYLIEMASVVPVPSSCSSKQVVRGPLHNSLVIYILGCLDATCFPLYQRLKTVCLAQADTGCICSVEKL